MRFPLFGDSSGWVRINYNSDISGSDILMDPRLIVVSARRRPVKLVVGVIGIEPQDSKS